MATQLTQACIFWPFCALLGLFLGHNVDVITKPSLSEMKIARWSPHATFFFSLGLSVYEPWV